jgi:hypothetical protein
MKLLNLLKEIYLNEAKQVGDLYHFTPLSNVAKILKSQYMIPNDEKQVSATRWADMSTAGFQDMQTKPVARFMFDGNKLSNKYQIRPFSYGDGATEHDEFEKLGEEQIVVNGRNFYFMPYLKRIDIFVQKGTPDLSKSTSILDKLNVPYTIYQGTPRNSIPYTQSKEGNPDNLTYKPVPKEILISTTALEHPYPNYKTYKFTNNPQTYPLPLDPEKLNNKKQYRTKRPLIFNSTWDVTPKYPNFYVKYSDEFSFNYEKKLEDFTDAQLNGTETYVLGSDYRNQITKLLVNSITFKSWNELGIESAIEKLAADIAPYAPGAARNAEDAGLIFFPKQMADKYLIPYEAKPVEYKKWVIPKK